MKSKLGKVTFVSLCAFLGLYALYIIFSILMFLRLCNFDLEYFFYFCNKMSILENVEMVHRWLAGPMICWSVFLIYAIIIAKGIRVKRFVYIITALAIFDNLLFIIIFDTIYVNEFSSIIFNIFFCLILIAYTVCFVLLFADAKKHKMTKIIRITAVAAVVCLVVYDGVTFFSATVRQMLQMSQFNFDYIFGMLLSYASYSILLVVAGLVLGYILFPEKYLVTEEQELCSENEAV